MAGSLKYSRNFRCVRSFAAILLLFVLLFNGIGYRFLCMRMEFRATQMLDARLDEHRFNSGEMVTFKIPLQRLAYYNSSSRFERRVGLVDIAGVRYQYLESRIFGDSIEFHCIPNRVAMNWAEGKNDFFNLVNGLQNSGSRRSGPRHANIMQERNDEYFPAEISIELPVAFISSAKEAAIYAESIPEHTSGSPDRPPQA